MFENDNWNDDQNTDDWEHEEELNYSQIMSDSAATGRPASPSDNFSFHQSETGARPDANGNPSVFVDLDSRFQVELGWQRASMTDANSQFEVSSMKDWRGNGETWQRQRDADGRFTNAWTTPSGQQWRGTINVLPDGRISEVQQSAEGATLSSRTYNHKTGVTVLQDAAGQVTQAIFPDQKVWVFEKNQQGVLQAKYDGQVMPGQYEFGPEGFVRKNNNTVERWNYNSVDTRQVVSTTAPDGRVETEFPTAQSATAVRRRTDFPAGDPDRVSQSTLVNGDVITKFKDGRIETEFKNHPDKLSRETTYPAGDSQQRTRSRIYSTGMEETQYQNRTDGLALQVRYPANDPTHRVSMLSYQDGGKVTNYNGRPDGMTLEQVYGPNDPSHRSNMQSFADGSKIVRYRAGHPDGMTSETTHAPGDQQQRSQTITFADGRQVSKFRDGSTETRRPDGSVTREWQDQHFGKVTRTNYPANSDRQYSMSFNGQTVTVMRNGEATWEANGQRHSGRVTIGADGSPYFHQAEAAQAQRPQSQSQEQSCQAGQTTAQPVYQARPRFFRRR